ERSGCAGDGADEERHSRPVGVGGCRMCERTRQEHHSTSRPRPAKPSFEGFRQAAASAVPAGRPGEGYHAPVTDQPLRIVPLGGLGEVGKNMMVYELGDSIVVVDAGIA